MTVRNNIVVALLCGALAGGLAVGCTGWWSRRPAAATAVRMVSRDVMPAAASPGPCDDAVLAERHRGLVRRTVSLVRMGSCLDMLWLNARVQDEKNPAGGELARWSPYLKASKTRTTQAIQPAQKANAKYALAWKDQAVDLLGLYTPLCILPGPEKCDPKDFDAWAKDVDSLEHSMGEDLRSLFRDVYQLDAKNVDRAFEKIELP